MSTRSLSLLLILGIPWLSGCGGAEIAPVTGRVMCNGNPVNAAAVTFSPVPKSAKDMEPGKPGTGFTEEDGTFVLSTYKALDGALVGEHSVSVQLDDTNPAPCKKAMYTKLEVKPGQNEFTLELEK